MKTIIDTSGKVLYATSIDIDLQPNEIAIDNLLQDNFITPYWNFNTETFYENATSQEISEASTPTEAIANEIVIDLLTKHKDKPLIGLSVSLWKQVGKTSGEQYLSAAVSEPYEKPATEAGKNPWE